MFALKAPLIEKIVAHRTGFLETHFPTISALAENTNDSRQERLKQTFILRRELWKKSLPELKTEVEQIGVKNAVLNCFPA